MDNRIFYDEKELLRIGEELDKKIKGTITWYEEETISNDKPSFMWSEVKAPVNVSANLRVLLGNECLDVIKIIMLYVQLIGKKNGDSNDNLLFSYASEGKKSIYIRAVPEGENPKLYLHGVK